MAKICVICGEDCSGRPRTKDRRGRYYCLGCYERARQQQNTAHQAESEGTHEVPSEPPPLSELMNGVVGEAESMPAAPAHTPTKPDSRREGPVIPIGSFVSPRMGLCLLGVILAGTFVFGNGFTFLFILFIALAVINGYWIGAAKIGALLGGLLAGALIGVPMGKAMEGMYAGVLHTSGAMNRILSIGLSAFVIFFIATVILQVLINRLLKDRPGWQRYDRVAGSGLGLLEGVLVACLAVWSILALEPIAAMSLAQTGSAEEGASDNPVSCWIVSISGSMRGSVAGRFADSTNPLSEARFLTLLADGVVVVNDPKSREAFINHPAIKRIESHPSVQEALRMLKEDEALCGTLETGSMGEVLKAILSSKTLLEVIDQTDIVAELSPLADEIELAIGEAMDQRTE